MNFVAGGEGVEVFGLVEIPEHGCAVFAAGCAEGAVGRDGDGVDVTGVADVVGLDAAGCEFPDLVECEYANVGFSMGRSSSRELEEDHQCIGVWLSHCPEALK